MATETKKPSAAPVKSTAPAAKKAAVKKASPVAAKKAMAKTAKWSIPVAPVVSVTPSDSKTKKTKLVRDSFTMPKDEYAVLAELKLRTAKLGHPAKKSELLRAGVKALNAMSDTALKSILAKVPAIKTGRPKKT